MSLLENFLKTIEGAGKSAFNAITGSEAGKRVFETAKDIATLGPARQALNTVVDTGIRMLGEPDKPAQQQAKETELRTKVQSALGQVKEFDRTVVGKTNDLILQVADQFDKEVYKPITRTMSTVGLLSDTNSPLYKAGPYEEGFQVTDIKRAWDRAQYVSPMVTLTKSDLIPLAGGVSSFVLKQGKVDTAQVDLWNDESIKKNFSDNIIGRWFTGPGDFVLGNAALGIVGKVVNAGVKSALVSGGFTANKAVAEIQKEVLDGFRYMDTNGAEGKLNTMSNHMRTIADTTDDGIITEIVKDYTNNEALIPILKQVSTKEAALDIILADKGDIDAMIRLTETNLDHLFEMADVPSQIRAKVLMTGEPFIPQAAAAQRIKDAMDKAIARDPRFDELRKAFLDDKYNIKAEGKLDYMPATPKFFTDEYVNMNLAAKQMGSALKYKDFENFGHIASLRFGSRAGQPVTEFVKIVSKGLGYKPLGLVTNSSVRAFDARQELAAFLDDISIFNVGAKEAIKGPKVKMVEWTPGQFRPVSDVRREFDAMLVNAKTDVEFVQALEEIDRKVGHMLAYANGHKNTVVIDAQISSMRKSINSSRQGLQSNGYATNVDGSFIRTNAQTLRQLAESYQFTPWNKIERQFLYNSKKPVEGSVAYAKDGMQHLYDDLSRLWTFDVLARPSFIAKQSFLEPIISVFLADGIQTARAAAKTFTMRGLYNGRNKVLGSLSRSKNYAEYKAVNKTVENIEARLQTAIGIKDNLQVELEKILSGTSPAIKEQYAPMVRKELEAASKLLDKLELEYRSALAPHGAPEAVPSLTMLERRIAFLERKTGDNIRAKIQHAGWNPQKKANIKDIVNRYKDSLHYLTINPKLIQDIEDQLAKAWDDVDSILKELGEAQTAQANVWGKSAKYKKEYLGKTSHHKYLPETDEYVDIDSFVNDPNGDNYVRAIKAEVSNSQTQELNFLNELSVGTRKAAIQRKTPNAPTVVGSPTYFEELANIANRYIRQEPLMDLILQGKSINEIMDWALSFEGKKYVETFGLLDESEILGYVQDQVGMVKRMFPSAEARLTIFEKEVTSQELQKMLAPYSDELFNIQPTDFRYAENDILGRNWFERIENFTVKSMNSVFQKLTSAENPIREAYFDKIATDIVAQKVAYLKSQGAEITLGQLKALRSGAQKQAIKEVEKTLYTTRRQNRALHGARLAVAFPTATLNAFYRYGRLAVKNPVRTAQFLHSYGAAFQSFGVDKNGNPTDNIDEIAYLMVPGTKDIPWLKGNGDGILLNARSIGFMLNWASPSVFTGVTFGQIMQHFDGTEDMVKKALGPLYETWFPYGAPTSVTKAFYPPWLTAAYNGIVGDSGRRDFKESWESVFNYHKMLIDLGIEKKMPSEEQIIRETQGLFQEKAKSSFMSPFGVPYKVSTNKMDLVETYYYALLNKYKINGRTFEEAKKLAGDEMLQTMGPGFMLDRVAFNAKTTRANIPETVEAWNVIFKDNDKLVNDIAGIKQGDISLIGILTRDLRVDPEDRSLAIANKLRDPNLTLPGGSNLVNMLKMTPQEVEKLRMKNRTWQQYTALKEKMLENIPEGKSLRSYPGRQAVLEQLANTLFKEQSPEWWNEYMNSQAGNSAWEYARAFQYALKDNNFMKSRKDSTYWSDIKKFMNFRTLAVTIYDSYPSGDKRKSEFKSNYLDRLQEFSTTVHPELRQIISNYFDNDNLKGVV